MKKKKTLWLFSFEQNKIKIALKEEKLMKHLRATFKRLFKGSLVRYVIKIK